MDEETKKRILKIMADEDLKKQLQETLAKIEN